MKSGTRHSDRAAIGSGSVSTSRRLTFAREAGAACDGTTIESQTDEYRFNQQCDRTLVWVVRARSVCVLREGFYFAVESCFSVNV
jgi:hypothetical protein